jgi:hypothetical protein
LTAIEGHDIKGKAGLAPALTSDMDELEKIIEAATQDLRKRLQEAYAAGGENVRRELLAVLSPGNRHHIDIAAVTASPKPSGGERRAAPGTVKPTILKLIEEASFLDDGISAAEIIRKTGFKENSVRGTISTLRIEKVIEQRGDRWFMKETPPSSEPEEGDS